MKREEAIALLRTRPVFWSRLGFCYDPPRAGADGRQIIFNRNFEKYQKTHDAFEKIGVQIHSGIIHSGWVKAETYDYEAADATLEAMLKGHPQRWYIPRVKLNVPPDWCAKYPEETFVYYNGPRDAEGIAALAGGAQHDWFGFDSATGYPVNGGYYEDDRENVGGIIGLQSFSSGQWLQDASEALRRFIRHLEDGPYGSQILAYHIAFGCCGETTHWGTWRPTGENARGDYGISHRKRFYQWLLARYGSLEELRKAWKEEQLTEETLMLMQPVKRDCREGESAEEMFDCRPLTDYHAYLSDCTAEAIECFGKIVRETCDKPVGAFYGYIKGAQAAYQGHLNLQRILNSPYVDFIASPRSYQYCAAGEPGGEQAASQTFNRKKVWLDELDSWTHLDPRKRPDTAANMEETCTLLWREACKNFAADQNFWWMDLGEGWFDDEEIMENIRRIFCLGQRLKKAPHKSTAQVLTVLDEEGMGCGKASYGLARGLRERLVREIRLSGVMVDEYCLEDLWEMDLSGYRFVVFLSAFAMKKEQVIRLREKMQKDTVFLWNFAPGIVNETVSLENTEKLTGFCVKPSGIGLDELCYHDIAHDFPALCIREKEEQKVRIRNSAGEAVLVQSADGRSYLASCPVLRTKELRRMLKEASVRLTAPEYCTVYEDNRFLAVFPYRDTEGEICLPEKGNYLEHKSGRQLEDVQCIRDQFAAKEYRVYEKCTNLALEK